LAYGKKEFRSSGVQEFRSSGVQEFRSSGVQIDSGQKNGLESQDPLVWNSRIKILENSHPMTRRKSAADSATPELLQLLNPGS
jgi:hypothetical protein